MTIRILVSGAYGKMGRFICRALAEHTLFSVVAQSGRHDNLALLLQTTSADIAIDVTCPESVWHNANTIIDQGVRPIIGTTGLSAAQITTLQERCLSERLGGMVIPNFAIGAALMMNYAKNAASYFDGVEIIEAHHAQKRDAPSGTAIRTAQVIAQQASRSKDRKSVHGYGGTEIHGVPIHSIRLPGIIAQQSLLFGTAGETLTLVHNVSNYEAYLPGLLLACRKVMTVHELIYGLENVIELA